MLHPDIIEAGDLMAENLIDAHVTQSMGNMGGHICVPLESYSNADLIKQYLDHEIVSVEAIYIAMQRAEAKLIAEGRPIHVTTSEPSTEHHAEGL